MPGSEEVGVDVALGFVLGVVVAVSVAAALRLALAPRRVLSPQGQAMQAAVHAATRTLPHLRRGLTAENAGRAVGTLRRLLSADAVALADRDTLLAMSGEGAEHHAGQPLSTLVAADHLARPDRVHVEPRLRCPDGRCMLRTAVVAPLVVGGDRIGSMVVAWSSERRLGLEDARVVGEAASLVSAQLELAVVEDQEERLARAELRALRAQISPHFVYNALAAIASHIHSDPDEARELLTEFAQFTRYAFRGERPYVTLADELGYVEKYLRLERARFGERLAVTLNVAPEVLPVVVPTLSLQPLVENAVRHGIEGRPEGGHVQILGRDLGGDVELRVTDDGAGITPEAARAALTGAGRGIGLSNVDGRLRSTFGDEYGLRIGGREGGGTAVTMTLPKFRAGVRAA
jgi:two-component system LytT family sensor kinase